MFTNLNVVCRAHRFQNNIAVKACTRLSPALSVHVPTEALESRSFRASNVDFSFGSKPYPHSGLNSRKRKSTSCNFFRYPTAVNTLEKKTVVVVGGGIIGLSTAQQLVEKGYPVVVVSKSKNAEETTSAVAAGFVFPYLLQPVHTATPWVRLTLDHCRDPPAADLIHPIKAYVLHVAEKVQGEPEWAGCGLNYRRLEDSELLRLNAGRKGWFPFVDGFLVDTFCFNTGQYLKWLEEELCRRGALIIRQNLRSLKDLANIDAVPDSVSAVVNCTGVYARELVADDQVRPIFGQVISLRPQAGIDTAYIIEDGTELMGGSAYVFPRPDKIICGGTAILDKWDEVPEAETTDGIISRVQRLLPELRVSRELVTEERCGLRPSRRALRLEVERGHELGVPIVHSYGHGGSGWTVFRGAAAAAAALVDSACRRAG